jgi:two-component system LytT family response regulator
MYPKHIRTIIVEDEPAARKALSSYLEKYCPQITVIATAENGIEGIEKIKALQPQLVFLDVEMPFANAFDVLDACKDIAFHTIFVTAFTAYAIKALNMSAAYYLLKPLAIEELIIAVNKVATAIGQEQYFNHNQFVVHNLQQGNEQQLVLPTLEGFDVIAIKDVVRLRGNGNFTNVHTTVPQEFMVCRFLKHFEGLLPTHFLRIHKSHIVNTHFIKSYHKGAGGYITLIDGTELEVSASYKESLLKHYK